MSMLQRLFASSLLVMVCCAYGERGDSEVQRRHLMMSLPFGEKQAKKPACTLPKLVETGVERRYVVIDMDADGELQIFETEWDYVEPVPSVKNTTEILQFSPEMCVEFYVCHPLIKSMTLDSQLRFTAYLKDGRQEGFRHHTFAYTSNPDVDVTEKIWISYIEAWKPQIKDWGWKISKIRGTTIRSIDFTAPQN